MSTKIKMIAMALLAMLGVSVYAQTPKELVEQGYKHSENGDYDKAIDCYRKAAQQGDAQGQDELGGMYLYGAGVEVDYATALEWFRKSAAQGFAEGQRDVGLMYHYGLGVEQDYAKALEWYNKAAQQGNAHAEKGLGDLYHAGNGVTQSYEQAAAWYRRAADHNDREAQNALGNCYYSGNGVQQSYEEAVKWYRKSAEQGFWWGEYNLGNMYYNGKGVTQNYEQAIQWYKKSSEKGVGDASNMVGMMYWLGNGVEKDQKTANEWFETGAKQGHAQAQANLGYSYENGCGVDKDVDKAVEWYEKAAAQGNDNAKNALDRIKAENEIRNALRIDKVEVRGRVIEPKTDELGRTYYDLGVVMAGRNDGDVCKMTIFNTSNMALELEIKHHGYLSFLKNNSKRWYNDTLQPKGKTVISFACTLSSNTRKEKAVIRIRTNQLGNGLIANFNYYGLSNSEQLAFMELDGKWGAKDINQKTVIPFEYEGIKDLGIWGIPAKKNGKWGWINRDNNVLIPFEYDDVIGGFKNDLARVKKNGNYYVINEKNAVVYNLPQNKIGGDLLIEVCERGGKYGYINLDNVVLIPAEYTDAKDCSDGLAVVQKNGKWGALDLNNQLIIPFGYEELFVNNSSHLYAKKNGKWGQIDKNNKIITQFIYDDWSDILKNSQK